MKRIAGELGVSITTVSKVLNNRADISEATRARVLAKVEELGYQRNAVARSLTPPPHPHPRHRHSRSDALVLRRDHRRHRAGRQRARLRPAAVQLQRGSRQGARRSSRCCAAGRSTASCSRRRTRSGNTDLLQQLTAHGTGLVMIDRDDHPSVKCHRVLTDDEQRRPAGDRRTCSISGAAPSRTSAARAIVARQAAREGLARRAARARHQGRRRVDRARRLHGERRLPRDEAAADACGRASTRCSPPTIRRRSAR